MSTKNEKVTAGKVVSATQEFSNLNDPDRKFNISVEANVRNGKVNGLNNGNVTRKDSTEYGNANFSAGENMSYFSFNSNGLSAEEVKEAIDASLSFIESVKANVEQNIGE